jgi:hypothetical protein
LFVNYSRETILAECARRGLAVPDGDPLPAWIISLLVMLTSEGLYEIPVWRDVLGLWLRLEQLNGYTIGVDLTEIPDLYPSTAMGWFNNRRSINWRPRCDKYGTCETQVLAAYQYWRYLQPSWRIGGEGFVRGDEGDFSALSMLGLDGWPTVLVAFFFAAGDFCGGGGVEVSEDWVTYVGDIKTAMGGLLAQSVVRAN